MGSRKIAGKKAKYFGDIFERFIVASCHKDHIHPVQIPSGCKQIRTKMGQQILRVRTPFDFIAMKDQRVIAFDAKTVDAETFSRSRLTPHQVESLYQCAKHIPAGLVIWFRQQDQISFFPIQMIMRLKKGQSLNPVVGFQLGTSQAFSLLPVFKSYLTIAELLAE